MLATTPRPKSPHGWGNGPVKPVTVECLDDIDEVTARGYVVVRAASTLWKHSEEDFRFDTSRTPGGKTPNSTDIVMRQLINPSRWADKRYKRLLNKP